MASRNSATAARIVPLDVAQNVAERVVGVGEVGLDADGDRGTRRSPHRLSPAVPRASQRLSWKVASSGWMRMAVRYSAIASSSFPCHARRSRG